MKIPCFFCPDQIPIRDVRSHVIEHILEAESSANIECVCVAKMVGTKRFFKHIKQDHQRKENQRKPVSLDFDHGQKYLSNETKNRNCVLAALQIRIFKEKAKLEEANRVTRDDTENN